MFAHIHNDPEILNGRPVIKGTRISVAFILELFASGAAHKDILKAYPQLSFAAIEEALRYAAQSLKNDSLFTTEIAS